jgi:hypothetical protein
MGNVKKLDLSFNSSLNFNDEWFEKMPKDKLEIIIVNHVVLFSNDFDIGIFSQFTNLHDLSIENIGINLDLASQKSESILKQLRYLNISGSFIDDKSIQSLFILGENIKCLNLSCVCFCKLDQDSESHEFMKYISFLGNLETLDISYCNLHYGDLKNILKCISLRILDLSGNSLDGLSTQMIHKLFSIKLKDNTQGYFNAFKYRFAALNTLE